MKKFLVWLALLWMLSGAAIGEALPQAAVTLAQRIDALADNNDYLQLMFGSDRLTERSREIAAGEQGQNYTMMVNVDLREAVDGLMESLAGDVCIDDPLVYEEIARRLDMVLLVHAIAAQGAETVAVVNSITADTMFACDETDGSGVYLIFYGEQTPVAVIWRVQNGAASLSAMFAPIPELQACATSQQVADWFDSIGARGVAVTEIK